MFQINWRNFIEIKLQHGKLLKIPSMILLFLGANPISDMSGHIRQRCRYFFAENMLLTKKQQPHKIIKSEDSCRGGGAHGTMDSVLA